MSPPDAISLKFRDEWMAALVAAGLHETLLRVALRLALHVNIKSGRLDPSYATISKGLGGKPAEQAVIRAVKKLEALGWIRVIRSGGGRRDRHRGRTNSFVLLPPPQGCHPGRHPCDALANPREPSKGVTLDDTLKGVTCRSKGVTLDDTRTENRNNESPNKEKEHREGNGREGILARDGVRDGVPLRAQESTRACAKPPLSPTIGFTNPKRNNLNRDDAVAIRALCEAWDRNEITEADFDREEAKIHQRANQRASGVAAEHLCNGTT